jgi:hypothetical protein
MSSNQGAAIWRREEKGKIFTVALDNRILETQDSVPLLPDMELRN